MVVSCHKKASKTESTKRKSEDRCLEWRTWRRCSLKQQRSLASASSGSPTPSGKLRPRLVLLVLKEMFSPFGSSSEDQRPHKKIGFCEWSTCLLDFSVFEAEYLCSHRSLPTQRLQLITSNFNFVGSGEPGREIQQGLFQDCDQGKRATLKLIWVMRACLSELIY